MAVFVIFGAVLLLLALAIVVWPLLKKTSADGTMGRSEANLQILRDQLAEIDGDLLNGALPQEQYESARAELERRVLEESQKAGADIGDGQTGHKWLAPALIGLLVPAASIALYAHLGNTDGFDVKDTVQSPHNITGQDVDRMVRQLEQHLAENPHDAEGWAMLGRSRWVMQQFDASARAWQRAAELRPDDPDVLTNYAEVLAMTAQGDLAGAPAQLLSRALQIQPMHPKGLALSGSAAFGRSDYSAAIEYWQRLLMISADDQELSSALKTGIAEARARLGQPVDNEQALAAGGEPTVEVKGDVRLSAQLSQFASPEDSVFIFARAAQGPGIPLAVVRVTVAELPYRFRLDDSMAMMPERKLSDFRQLVVGARVSKSGSAARSSGDLEGFSAAVTPDSGDVRIVIDQRVP
jgi:cytochrome c-type biogenesis protein CcmH